MGYRWVAVTAPPTGCTTALPAALPGTNSRENKNFSSIRKKKPDGFRPRNPGKGSSLDLSVMNGTIQKRLKSK